MSQTMSIAEARRSYGVLHLAALTRAKERQAVEREHDAAEARVGECQAAMRSADGLADVKEKLATLTGATTERDALATLAGNLAARAREGVGAEKDAHDLMVQLEQHAEALRAERIPQLEAALTSRRDKHAELARMADAYVPLIREAERSLNAARLELAALGE